MKILLQRVSSASVSVAGERVSAIGAGLLLFLGVEPDDGEPEVLWLADKVLGLRIFPDADKPMNRSVMDSGGELLLVSQFTLAADTSRGKRPGFSSAAPPERARELYHRFAQALCDGYDPGRIQTGRFGADMAVALVNDGPVTFLLER